MEDPKSHNTCRTCLGSFNILKNLCDEKNKNLLDLLHGILGLEIKDQVFKICKKCETKLKSVRKFKDVCLKSLENFGNFKCKDEPFNDGTDYNSSTDNEIKPKRTRINKKPTINNHESSENINNLKSSTLYCNAASIESTHSNSNDSFDYIPVKKSESKESLPSNNDIIEDIPLSKRGVRLDQFPRTAVLEAMAACRSFFTNVKHKSCLHCKYVGKTARGLSVHMSFMHSILAKSWCYQCNIQTTDLPTHQQRKQCAEYYCKFCGKFACPIKRACEHLRFHCSKESLDDVLSKRGLWHEQFSRRDVRRAIVEHKAHFTSAHSTTCLHCDYVGETGRGLSIHMSTLHRAEAKNWCYRCNIQTVDIEVHKNGTKCFLYFCKFCDKYTCLIKHAKTHLESHCHGLSTLEENENISDGDEIDENLFKNNTDDDISIENDDKILNILVEKEATVINPLRENAPDFTYLQQEKKESSYIDDTFETCVTNNNDCNIIIIPLRGSSEFNIYPHDTVEKALGQILKRFYTTRQCPACDVVLLNLPHLQKHVRLQHRDLKSTWCDICNTLEENLIEHSKTHESRLFQCAFCDKSYESVFEIKEHIIHHSDLPNSELNTIWFNCKFCPTSFLNEADWTNHKCVNFLSTVEQNTDPEKSVATKLKNKISNAKLKSLKSKRKKSLSESLKIISSKKFKKCLTKKPKVTQLCSICGKVVGKVDFRSHMKIHNGALFKCSHCDKQFTHKIYLIEHEKRHTGEKTFLCGTCGKAFVTSSECKRHERIHEGGPQHCPICDIQCNRPERLKLHMKRHTGENKFACAHCGISFHIKSLLLKHIKSHSDERPHKCSFCEIYFKHREEVTVHERTHTGIRPYSCTLCTFTSVRSKELTNHMKKHPEDAPQANTPYSCQFCTKKFSTNAMMVSHTRNKHEYLEK